MKSEKAHPGTHPPGSRLFHFQKEKGDHRVDTSTNRSQPRQRPALYQAPHRQGKQASAANATREGFTRARPGEEARYEAMRTNLLEELDPFGEFQTQCFDVILHAAWNVQRCMVLEGELQLQAAERGALDAMPDDELALKLHRLYRYKKMHENSQRRAVAELRRLQTGQLYRAFRHPETVACKILLESVKVDANVPEAQ